MKLNSIFRNVKENTNLDLLEESDDEEEFENVDPGRYIQLKDGLTMQMQFIPRFNGWCPCEVVSQPPTAINEIERLQSMFKDVRRTPRPRQDIKPTRTHMNNNWERGGRGQGAGRGRGRGYGMHQGMHSRWLGVK